MNGFFQFEDLWRNSASVGWTAQEAGDAHASIETKASPCHCFHERRGHPRKKKIETYASC